MTYHRDKNKRKGCGWMRILMVNKFLYQKGGAETYVLKLGEYLASAGHQVQYFGMNHEGRCVGNKVNAYTRELDFHSKGIEQLSYPFKIIYSNEARKKIRLVLDDFKPDVVHLNNFNYQLTPSIILEIRNYEKRIKGKVKIVYTAHDYQLLCPNHMMNDPNTKKNCEKCIEGKYGNCIKQRCIHGSLAKSILGALEGMYWNRRKVYQYLDAVICPSEFMKKKIDQNFILKNKTVLLYNFLEQESSVSQQKKDYVLYFGRYSEEKGIRTLLEVCKKLSHVPFVFAGIGPMEEEIPERPNIRNVGFKKGAELKQLIQQARFSICPSEWYENCPFSVMESQLYGTPVIGANIGGIPELIKEHITGEIFESGNARDLEKKISELWKNKEKCDTYANNCKNISFDTLSKYYEKLLLVYQH